MAGRPLTIATPEEFEAKVEAYRQECAELKRHVTFSGLAHALGFESRPSLYDYAKREAFSYTVKRAVLTIMESYEQRLFDPSAGGAIFALKNHGWTDAHQVSGPDGGPIEMEVHDARRRLAGRITGIASRIGAAAGSVGANGNGSGGH